MLRLSGPAGPPTVTPVIAADAFCAALGERGWAAVTGVPCPHLAGAVALMTAEPRRYGPYLPAGDAAAAAAYALGAAVAGTRTAVVLPSVALDGLIDPVAALAVPYGLPVLLLVGLSGWPDPGTGRPRPVLGGDPARLLDLLEVLHRTLDGDPPQLSDVLDEAAAELDAGRCAAVLVPPGTLAPPPPRTSGLTRTAAVAAVLAALPPRAALVCAAGPACRAVDRPGALHLTGDGLAFGLGVAARRPDRPVVVLEEPLRWGALVTAGTAGPANLVHVVLDDPDPSADLATLALAAGYRGTVLATTAAEVVAAVGAALAGPGPRLVRVPVGPIGLLPAPREPAPRAPAGHEAVPREPVPPAVARDRFARWLSGHAS